MAKFEVIGHDVVETISYLKCYRSGWANDIREGWSVGSDEAKEILYSLYEIAGTIILALENRLNGDAGDKMALHITKNKLLKLTGSEAYGHYAALGELHACNVVTSGTIHHVNVMHECLDVLMA